MERKSARIEARTLAESVCMYANTQPHGGVILVGVENDGAISGCSSLSTEQLNRIEQVREYCPDARLDFTRVAIKNSSEDEDFITAIRVYYREDRLVETTSSEAFVRAGDKKRKLTEPEKREIRINKGEVEYELEPVTLSWPHDFDGALIDQFVSSYVSKRRITRKLSRDDVLSQLHLGRQKDGVFHPNLACVLVFANNPRLVIPGARIRITKYDGSEEQFGRDLNQVFDTFVDGPLPQQIAEAERIISSQIRSFTRLGADSRFYTRPEYPHEVWLEAVINAAVHRSYNLKYMNIFVKIFDNRFVVESPGGFLPPTTAETVYEGHNPRNPYTMEALFYLDFVHCAYEGTWRMRESMREANLPEPDFSQKQVGTHQVHVTLKNDVEHRKTFLQSSAAEIVGSDVYARLTEHEKILINFVAEKSKISVSDASRLIAKDWHGAKAVLEHLVEHEVFELPRRSGKERESSKRYIFNKKTKRP